MRIIDKFVDYVDNYNYTDGGFLIEGDEGKARFTAMEIGPAVFIYGRRVYGDGVPDPDETLHLAAIIGLNAIYIVNTALLNPCIFKDGKGDIKYPLHSLNIKDFNINNWVKKNVFPEFYNKLPIVEVDNFTKKRVLNAVRAELFGLSKYVSSYKLNTDMEDIFDVEEYPKILAGTIDVKYESYERLEQSKDYYSVKKTKMAMYNEMLNNGESFYQAWEKQMAEALKSVIDSNYVTVEFQYNDKTSGAKVNTRSILYSLIEQKKIECTAFDTFKNCEKVEKDLCTETIHCDNISKITYRGKTLYEKV